MCVRHGVDIIYHAALADSEALDMVESVKDSVFVAPAVGFPCALLHEARSTASISTRELDGVWKRNWRSQRTTCASFTDVVFASSPAATTAWPAHRRAATHGISNCSSRGFSPSESLVAATNPGGAMMGLGDELGQLRPGWHADLIVVDGDPIEDIAVLQDRQRINLVMKDGHIYRDELSAGGTSTS